MVTSNYDIENSSVYQRAVHQLLEQREMIHLAPNEDARMFAQRQFDRTLVHHLASIAKNKPQQSSADDHTALCDVEAYAAALAYYSSPYALEKFNSFGRFNFEREPGGGIKKRMFGSNKGPVIISESPPLQPHELQREVCRIFLQGESLVNRIGRYSAAETKVIRQMMEGLVSDLCEKREITQEPPEWFKEKWNDAPDGARVEDAWDAFLIRLVNHKHEMHPVSDLGEFKQERLAKNELDSKSAKHCYGIFLPWAREPVCATYTYASQSAEAGYYKDNIRDIVHARGHADHQERIYVYSTVSFDDVFNSDLPTKKLYEQIFKEFLEKFSQAKEPDKEAQRLLSVSPLTGFPGWLSQKLEERGDALFTAQEHAKARMLTKGVVDDEEGVSAYGFIRHYVQFTEPSVERRVKICSPEPVFSEFPQEQKESAKAYFDALMLSLARQFVFEAWKEGDKVEHVDPSIHLHASNGARLVNLDVHPDGDEWARSAGVVANFYYLPNFPPAYSRMYEHDGWFETEPGAQIAKPIWEEYLSRKELLHPTNSVESPSGKGVIATKSSEIAK